MTGPRRRLHRGLILGLVLAGACAVQPAVVAQSCAQTAGPVQARRYVDQCLMVSPATHPPCNTANPCPLIQDEIRRGCALLGANAPAFCHSDKTPG